MKSIQKLSLALLAAAAIGLGSCDKTKQYDIIVPPSQVHFNGNELQNYSSLATPDTAHTIYVGTTDVAQEDRTFSVVVTSTTGATAGTQYTVSSNTVTIPKGQTSGSFKIKAAPAAYAAGRKDTLIVAFGSTLSVPVAGFLDTVKLAVRGACQESEIVFSQMIGTYTKTFENGSYGPYTSTLISPINISATSSSATLTNIYESGISASVVFNYAGPAPFTATIPDQATGFTSGGLPMRIVSSAPGTFSYCNNTIRLPIRMYTTAGTVDTWVTTLGR